MTNTEGIGKEALKFFVFQQIVSKVLRDIGGNCIGIVVRLCRMKSLYYFGYLQGI